MGRQRKDSRSQQRRFYKPVLERLEDRYVPSSSYSLALDFGTTASPLAAGYQRGILQNYTSGIGYGWQSLVGLQAINRTNIANALTRDFNQGPSGTYEVAASNGNYNVTIEMGDAAAVHNNISVWFNNHLVISNLSTSKGQFVTRTFPVQISNGMLLVRLSGTGKPNSTFALVSLTMSAVTQVDQPPTNITLSNSSVSESLPVGTLVGTLTTTDPDVGDSFTYSLVSGTGSTDNSLFQISGNQLLTNSIFSYATQSTRSVRLRTTDSGGLWYEKAFTISILPVNVNHAPTDIQLSSSTLSPNQPIGSLVGSFTTTDPDLNNTFTYSLVSGTGSTDNARFIIAAGNQLDTAQVLPIGTYSIRVRSTDQGGLYTEKVFPISVVNAPIEPLLYQSNVQYLGGFRVPNYTDATDTLGFGGSVLGFNPVNNSLFIVGQHQGIAEVSIPANIVNSSDVTQLATGTMLQPFTSVLPRLQNQLSGTTDGAPIGGLMVSNGRLIGTQYAYYSGSNTQVLSHFVVSSLNLSTASVQGLYQVGTLGGRKVAGYMAPIPSEWQGPLGAPDLTGLADVNILSTSSSGPAAFGFDPNALGTNVAPATPYVYYTCDQPLAAYTGPADPMQSGTSTVNGAVFMPGTSSVLFFGVTGKNYEGYGTPQTYGDNLPGIHGGTGPHSLNGEYSFQVWAYNANDFVSVKQGTLQPGQVQPYDVWNFSLPLLRNNYQLGGVAFDPASGRIYLAAYDADNQVPYSDLPLIEVFQVNIPQGAPTQAHPEVGTLAATPSTTAPGPVPAGVAVTLTSGNVYAIDPGTNITQVAFYRDSNNDGILETGTDQLLGLGTVSPASHNWTMTLQTTGMATGNYTIFAQATQSDGLLSNPIAITLTIV
jgi:hypothetical protein